jgi:Na+/H+ antiporter NhaD/arsenite permease-like protein
MARLWPVWLLATGFALTIFFVIDRHNYRKLPDEMEHEIEKQGEQFAVSGVPSIVLLVVILLAVFLPSPVREIVMLLAAMASSLGTARHIHEKNTFNFSPIKEVAILFAGIFATMTPAMDWLSLNAGYFGVTKPAQYYWLTGLLSGFLDNAPTYINSLSAACGLHGLSVDNHLHVKTLIGLVPAKDLNALGAPTRAGGFTITTETYRYVLAISAGAVAFGATTYIGNGPNFMVKSIAGQSHVKMPSFFGYMVKYSIPVLLPIFVLIWLIFFL